MTSFLQEKYKKEIQPLLKQTLNYSSIMQVPQINKIVINMGLGLATQNSAIITETAKELALITGQQPLITKAKKSISNFKLREGNAIGLKVTLRKEKMYHFLAKLINIALPKVRDFRGISNFSFDGRGNYTLGIKEHIIFPEISLDKIKKIKGMDITLVTTALTNREAFLLLKQFNLPFKNKEKYNGN